tara:strand:- start:1698 stop:1871 length:174 start_codon:yes stop_codon:yes gene_type:complete
MIDKYTKAVLTVIAVCLCLITVQMINIIPAAQAADDKIHKIAICNMEGRCAAVLQTI